MSPLAFPASPRIALAGILRPPVRALREAGAWWCAGLAVRGRGARVVFLPSAGREGAALLRIYAMSAALRRLGWRTLVLPATLTLAQRRRILGAVSPHLVVMQGARHVLNRPALYPEWPVLYDMDDADFHLAHLAAPVTEAMGQVAAVVAGSRYVADWAQRAGAARAEVIWTGSPVSRGRRLPQAGRPPVVAWAQTRPMTYRREAALVARVTARLAAASPGLTLRLFDRRAGDDMAFAASFAAPGLTVEWVEARPYRHYLRCFDDVALSLAPLCPETAFSRGKSFGKVLAALDRKVPVIGSDACEHGAFFTPDTGVITNDPDRWVAVGRALLADGGRRQAMTDAAHAAFLGSLTTEVAAGRLSGLLWEVISDDARAMAR